MPNFSSSLFDSTCALSSNRFASLSSRDSGELDNSLSSTGSDLGPPLHTSSPVHSAREGGSPKPQNLKMMVINFQSIKNKIDLLGVMLEDDIDIIIGTETWLNPHIGDSEILPPSHKAVRRDRADGYGGVMLIVRQDLVVKEMPILGSVEFLVAQIVCG